MVCGRDEGEARAQTVNGVRIHRLPARRRRGGKGRYAFEYISFTLMALAKVTGLWLRRRHRAIYVLGIPNFLVFSALVPRLGGSLGAFDLKKSGERLPILRRWAGESENPRALGSSPMVPWFNRISGGGFTFGGTFYPVAPNDPMEPVPLHGDGWTSAWEVVESKRDRAELKLRAPDDRGHRRWAGAAEAAALNTCRAGARRSGSWSGPRRADLSMCLAFQSRRAQTATRLPSERRAPALRGTCGFGIARSWSSALRFVERPARLACPGD